MHNIFFDRDRWNQISAITNIEGVFMQYSKLRLVKELLNGTGAYRFNFNKDDVNIELGDVALDRNDLFIPFATLLALQFDTIKRTGRAPLISYPIAASAAARGFINPEHVEALYNGIMEIKMNTTAVSDSFPLEGFRHVPETQPIIAKDINSEDYSIGAIPQFDFEKVAKQVVPVYFLQGDVDTTFTVMFNGQNADFSIAEAAAPTEASDTNRAYLVLEQFGILVKCGSNRPADIIEKLQSLRA